MSRGFRLQVETLDGRDLPDANPAAMMTAPIPADTSVVLAQAVPLRPPVPNDLPDRAPNDLPPPIVRLLPATPLEPELPPLLGPPAPIPPRQDLPPTPPMPQPSLPVQPILPPQVQEPQGPFQVVPQGPINPESLFPGPYPRNPYQTMPNPFLPGTPNDSLYVGGPSIWDPFDAWHVNADGSWSYTWPVTPVNPTP